MNYYKTKIKTHDKIPRDHHKYSDHTTRPVCSNLITAPANITEEAVQNILDGNAVEIDSEDAAEWLCFNRDLELIIEAISILCGNLANAEPVQRDSSN